MSSGEVPEGRCGFVLEPGDVPIDWVADDYEAGADRWYKFSGSACCWRDIWDGSDGGRCIWHAESDDKSTDALIEARADGPEQLDGAYVPAVDLGNAIDFEDCRLWAATFDGTGLREASFAGVNGWGAQFPDADLSTAQFPDASLGGAEFPNANLGDTEFPNANLGDAHFRDADLYRAQFPDADLRGAQFPDADLRGAQFPGADLWEAQFPDAILWDAEFPDVELGAAEFPDADLRGAQFPDANLRYAQFPDADLYGTQFYDADLWRAQFHGADLGEAQFHDADLRRVLFPDADFRRADLTNADARIATFTNATLEGATLRDADLGDAGLTDARLHDAHLLDVRINGGTTFDSVVPEETDAGWFDGPIHAVGARLRWWLTLLRLDAENRVDRYEQLDRARSIYRTIQRLYRENSMPRRIDTYHVRARDTRRKQAIIDGDLPRWLYLAGQRWVMGYGERPLRVVATSLAVVGLSGLLYPLWGLAVGKATGPPPRVIGYPFDGVGLVTGLGKSLYLSVITFTTLGYGDVQPLGHGEALATAESLVGAFLMALLVYVLGRRATR